MFRLTRFADCPAFDQRPVAVVDPNLGAFHFSRQPFGIADGKLPITVPKAERYPSCGLKQPVATVPGMRNDLEGDGLGVRFGWQVPICFLIE